MTRGKSPTHFNHLAHTILEREISGRATPIDVAQAIEGAFRRLSDVMSPLVGLQGLSAVMMRAIHLAGSPCAWLSPKEVGGTLVSSAQLAVEIERKGPAEPAACAATILGHTIALLCSFIGDDLTFRVLRRVWPDLGAP